MSGVSLVVSRPPFKEGLPVAAVGSLIGQAAFETGLFLKYPLPDLLKVAPDPAAAEAAAKPFRDLGVAADVVPFDTLCDMPPPLAAEAFGLTDQGILFVLESGDILAAPQAMQLLVVWKVTGEARGAPLIGSKGEVKSGGGLGGFVMGQVAFSVAGPLGSALVGHVQKMRADLAKAKAARAAAMTKAGPEKLIADLYLLQAGSYCRVRLDQSEIDYSGLGPQLRPESYTNWNTLLAEFRRRAPSMRVNDDMIRTRPPAVTGKYLTVDRVIDQPTLKQYQLSYPAFYSALLAWRVAEEMVRAEIGEVPDAPPPVAGVVEAPPAPPAPPRARPPGWGRRA